jgi:site-specific DNA-methyltransferase (adenine-specific)
MYELNNIYNEDSYEAIKHIPDNSIDLIIIDPPYEINATKGGMKSDLAKSIQLMNNQIENKRDTLLNGINDSILNELLRIQEKVNIYIWCNHKQIIKYLDFFVTKNDCKFDILIWEKSNATPLFSNKYMTDKEYCLYFRKGGYCNPPSYEDAHTVFRQQLNLKDKQKFLHPTIKPLNIIKTLIKNSSKENDIVADFFLGSGTTCVAAKELGRQYIGFEIDREYYEIAKNRLNGITANGQTSIFTDFEKEV